MKSRTLQRIGIGLLAAGLLFSTFSSAFSEDIVYPEIKTSSGFSRAVQTATGFTALSGFVANRIIKKELSRHVQGDLKSSLKLFSGTDLFAGKARGFRISGKDVLYDRFVPISEFHMESNREMPLFIAKDRRPFLLRPTQFKVSAVISEADMNRMLQSEKGKKLLTNLKVEIPPFSERRFDALDPLVDIVDDKVAIKSKINLHAAPIENALPIEIMGKISADEKARLKLSDVDLSAEGIDREKMELVGGLIENYFGELANLNNIKIERHKLKIAINRSELRDEKLFLEATITVKPEDKVIRKYLSRK